MIPRRIEQDVVRSLEEFPVVGLIGSRQVGKTTLARIIASRWEGNSTYLDLERPSDQARLSDPEFFLEQRQDHLVVLDEVQRRPDLFPILRALVDAGNRTGRFLLLGSASPTLRRQSAESLAGRIVYHEMAPLSLDETGAESWSELWLRGGYASSFLAKSDSRSHAWRTAFIATYLERDLPLLGIRVPAEQLRRFWEMLAHSHAQLWNASKIGSSLGVTAPTVRHYLDLLSDTFLLRQLQPWSTNSRKRLVKSPKVYLRDSGLLHALLRLRSLDELQGHPIAGASWEGWVIEQSVAAASDLACPFFYRTQAGSEVDLVLVPPNKAPVAVEIKLGSTPRPSRGLHEAISDLRCKAAFIVYPGPGRSPERLAPGIAALPVAHLDELRAHL